MYPHPGCAARPWALGFNAFGVTTQRRLLANCRRAAQLANCRRAAQLANCRRAAQLANCRRAAQRGRLTGCSTRANTYKCTLSLGDITPPPRTVTSWPKTYPGQIDRREFRHLQTADGWTNRPQNRHLPTRKAATDRRTFGNLRNPFGFIDRSVESVWRYPHKEGVSWVIWVVQTTRTK